MPIQRACECYRDECQSGRFWDDVDALLASVLRFSSGRTETDEVRDLLGVAFAVNRLRTHGRIGDGFEDVVASSRRIVGRERAH